MAAWHLTMLMARKGWAERLQGADVWDGAAERSLAWRAAGSAEVASGNPVKLIELHGEQMSEAISQGHVHPVPTGAMGQVPVLPARSLPGRWCAQERATSLAVSSCWSFPADCLCRQSGPAGTLACRWMSHLGGPGPSAQGWLRWRVKRSIKAFVPGSSLRNYLQGGCKKQNYHGR